jgi:RNA polymerase sigma-70 factor, ECF subfamily
MCWTERNHDQASSPNANAAYLPKAGDPRLMVPTASADLELIGLIEGCAAGDEGAFRVIFERFSPAVYRLCLGMLGGVQDAEDITQETFVYAFRNVARYDLQRSAFRTWLFMIAISRCRNQRKRRQWILLDPGDLLAMLNPAPASQGPEAALARQEANAAISSALATLSPRLREAIVLRYGHGLTYREIAETLDCPRKTVESRVRLAHEHLRRVLRSEGHALLEELGES